MQAIWAHNAAIILSFFANENATLPLKGQFSTFHLLNCYDVNTECRCRNAVDAPTTTLYFSRGWSRLVVGWLTVCNCGNAKPLLWHSMHSATIYVAFHLDTNKYTYIHTYQCTRHFCLQQQCLKSVSAVAFTAAGRSIQFLQLWQPQQRWQRRRLIANCIHPLGSWRYRNRNQTYKHTHTNTAEPASLMSASKQNQCNSLKTETPQWHWLWLWLCRRVVVGVGKIMASIGCRMPGVNCEYMTHFVSFRISSILSHSLGTLHGPILHTKFVRLKRLVYTFIAVCIYEKVQNTYINPYVHTLKYMRTNVYTRSSRNELPGSCVVYRQRRMYSYTR